GAGLRISEACNLDVDDVEAEPGAGSGAAQIRVRLGKGRKDRIVPLGSKGWLAVQRYLPHRGARIAAAGAAGAPPALFVSRRGKRLDPRVARRLLARRE